MARIADHRQALTVMFGSMIVGSVLLGFSALFFDLMVNFLFCGWMDGWVAGWLVGWLVVG